MVVELGVLVVHLELTSTIFQSTNYASSLMQISKDPERVVQFRLGGGASRSRIFLNSLCAGSAWVADFASVKWDMTV